MDNVDIKKVWDKLTPQERKEIDRLLQTPVIPSLLKDSFPVQTAFINDKHKLKALLGTRRMAKSYTAGLYLIKTALEKKNTSSVYIGLTRDQAKRIIWNDVFKTILKKYNVPHKLNETELTITLDNGSIIYVLGVDDSESEKDKLLGKKYALAIIDEAASYSIDLDSLIYKVLKPAMSDLGGTICLIGTPDDRKDGIFYELTKDIDVSPPQRVDRQGWKVYTWSTVDNPYMKAQWDETIRDLKEADPHIEEQPWFQQHYLGKWVVDTSNKIYRYTAERNNWNGKLKDYGWKPWQYTLGIDLGFNDATALVLLAYHEHDPHVYVIKSDKWKGLTLTETADKIRQWMGDYPIGYFIVDGANKQGVEEIVKHHQLPLQAADKHDKVSFIRIMNSDFISGKILVCPSTNDKLIDEWDRTIWHKKWLEKGIYKEDPSFHPDCCDAALYAYRFCYHYAHSPEQIKRDIPIEEQWRKQKEQWDRELEEQKAIREANMEGNEYLFT
jgi:hypothetical protein